MRHRNLVRAGVAAAAVALVLVSAQAAAARPAAVSCTPACDLGSLGSSITELVVGRLAAAGVVPAAASATPVVPSGTLFVSAATGNDAGSCTEAAPCKTIGRAVDAAAAGNRIEVGSGTYPETVTLAKRLDLEGSGATVDASGKLNGIVVSGGDAAGSVVNGFTVENAIAEGILVTSTSDISVTNNTVTGNDTGANTTVTPECTPQGAVPGDCGEAVHLMGVASSRIANNDIHHNVGGILVTDETGPSHGNLISGNTVHDNAIDCGITLPSHNPQATSDPSKAGVYDNTIVDNLSQRNGGAGVGMFGPVAGTASYDNRVMNNRLLDNGEAGAAIHAHEAGVNVSGNVITGNTISGNGVDPDANSGAPVGIAVLTIDPSSGTITDNSIDNEHFGVFINGPFTANGVEGNIFGSAVTVPIGSA